MLISIDTETTGLDRVHGARPFLVTVCRQDGRQLLWEFNVDPKTRVVTYPPEDVEEIRQEVDQASEICGHNIRFDVEHLKVAGIIEDWPWQKTYCTLMAGHLLASGTSHTLDDMVFEYLLEDIKQYESALKECVVSARRVAKTLSKSTSDDLFEEAATWRIAKNSDPSMPSAGGDAWHFDYWLPKAIATHLDYPKPRLGCKHWWDKGQQCKKCNGHRWHIVTSEYANVDSRVSLQLWVKLKGLVKDKGLWKIYAERIKLLPVVKDIEIHGVTYDVNEGRKYLKEYEQESSDLSSCIKSIAISIGYDLDLTAGVNHSLRRFCFGYKDYECAQCNTTLRFHSGQAIKCARCKSTTLSLVKDDKCLGLVPGPDGYTETGTPSLDAASFLHWQASLQPGIQKDFVAAFSSRKELSTSINYLKGYERYAIRNEALNFWVMYPNLNPTRTATLRFSSDNPNSQNVGKGKKPCRRCNETGIIDGKECQTCSGEGEISHNLRRAFRPALGREFWALDYENLEMMIPGYKAGQKEWIELFERPNEPPYWGSQHLLNASIIFPDAFWPLADFPPDDPRSFKKKHAGGLYVRIKGFDFALNYQCGEATGDASAGVSGAWRKIKDTLKELTKYNDYWVAFARRNGYVETCPDKTVDPTRGYPIMVSRNGGRDVSPTVPLNYHVQSTAMWCTSKAMVRCHQQCKEWNEQVLIKHGLQDASTITKEFFLQLHGYHIALQIHDELLFDFPAGGKRNLARALRLKSLMEESGSDIDVPLRVAVSYHPHSWADSCRI